MADVTTDIEEMDESELKEQRRKVAQDGGES